jgi:hypothetical protein
MNLCDQVATPRIPHVSQAFKRLEEIPGKLEEQIERLDRLIVAVLSEETPSVSKELVSPNENWAPLATGIRDVSTRIERLISQLERINNRIEL